MKNNQAAINFVDQFSVLNPLKGSTKSIFGVIGTLIVFILMISLYSPVVHKYLQGDFYQTQLKTTIYTPLKFYSDKDLKMAIQFLDRTTNNIADHSQLFQFVDLLATQFLADQSQIYTQELLACQIDYFKDSINPIYFNSTNQCLIFPHSSLLYFFYKKQSRPTQISMQLIPRLDFNPFVPPPGSQATGFYGKLKNFLKKYYYKVYFTSRIIDNTGISRFYINTFFSTDLSYAYDIISGRDVLSYTTKNTFMDLSIMPWNNNVNKTTLQWIGEVFNARQDGDKSAGYNGPAIFFQSSNFNYLAYRYYRKLDWLLGILGGAMLLFYIIVYIPASYINRNLHKIYNTQHLLLIDNSQGMQPTLRSNLTATKVSCYYWISNFITRFFSQKVKQSQKMVIFAEYELDVVKLIKRMKVAERNIKKCEIYTDYCPKVLKIKKKDNDEQSRAENSQANNNLQQNLTQRSVQYEEQQFKRQTVDPVFQFTQFQQKKLLEEPQHHRQIYQINPTMRAFIENEQSMNRFKQLSKQFKQIKQIQIKDKNHANYPVRIKGKIKKLFLYIGKLISQIDVFAATPSLSTQTYGATFFSFLILLFVIGLSIFILFTTLSNSISPQYITNQKNVNPNSFGYMVRTGDNFKFAFCVNKDAEFLWGPARILDIKFYTEDALLKKTYYNSLKLNSSSFIDFQIKSQNFFGDISNCFTVQKGKQFFMGKKQYSSNLSYFGIQLVPYCPYTPSQCITKNATILDNYLHFINQTGFFIYLPSNRFQPTKKQLITQMVQFHSAINYLYMKPLQNLQQTVYVDYSVLKDDTQNWFMRNAPKVIEDGISTQINTPTYQLIGNINSTTKYTLKIKPTDRVTQYLVTTPKADLILSMIGGVFVFFYAIFQTFAKYYNKLNIRSKLAQKIYDQHVNDQWSILKFMANSPLPTCIFPTICGIKSTIIKLRMIDKKISNQLNYLWLIKYTFNIFNLSTALFEKPQQKRLSMIYLKQKIDPTQQIKSQQQKVQQQNDGDDDIFNNTQLKQDLKQKNKFFSSHKKVANQSFNQDQKKLQFGGIPSKAELMQQTEQILEEQHPKQQLNQHMFHQSINQKKWQWFDMFDYPASLTFQGKRKVGSCCGGLFFIILLVLLIIIVNFELKVYFNRSDTRFSQQISLLTNSGETDSKIRLVGSQNFKFSVQFLKAYQIYPHDVSSYKNIAFSIFQNKLIRNESIITQTYEEIPLTPCSSTYLSEWASATTSSTAFANTNLGFCLPKGTRLNISGLPGDEVRQFFTFSIYSKNSTQIGRVQTKDLLSKYSPYLYISNSNNDYSKRSFNYTILQQLFDMQNVTYSYSTNISLSKIVVKYNQNIDIDENPPIYSTYKLNPFQQQQSEYLGDIDTNTYFNITFSNSHAVVKVNIVGDKFVETFGIIGGLIALLIFGFGFFPKSYNRYRLRYLIGKELYQFDILKSTLAKGKARGRKTQNQIRQLQKMNKYNQFYILIAYVLSPLGRLTGQYQFNKTLKRVTLIQNRVDTDLSLVQFYKKLHNMRDILDNKFTNNSIKYSDIYPKLIFNKNPIKDTIVDSQNKINSLGKKNNWSAYDLYVVYKAKQARIVLKRVFNNQYLAKALNMEFDSDASIRLSQYGGTVGSALSSGSVQYQRQQPEHDQD